MSPSNEIKKKKTPEKQTDDKTLKSACSWYIFSSVTCKATVPTNTDDVLQLTHMDLYWPHPTDKTLSTIIIYRV